MKPSKEMIDLYRRANEMLTWAADKEAKNWGAYERLMDALASTRKQCQQPNARFWTWWNNDWVKITLKPGKEVSLWDGGRTDEGWYCHGEHYEYVDGVVWMSWSDDETDCDGRFTTGGTSSCEESKLQARQIEDDIYCPVWAKCESSQRDYAADRMGY